MWTFKILKNDWNWLLWNLHHFKAEDICFQHFEKSVEASNTIETLWVRNFIRRRRLHKHTLCLYVFAPTEHMIQENSKILLKNIDWRKNAPSKYFQNVRDILLSLSTLFLRISKKLLSSSKSRIKERISLNSNVFLSYKVRLLTFSNHLLGQCTSFSRLFSF